MKLSLFKIKHLYLFVGSLLLLYVVHRALNIRITYDEAWTLESFVRLNFMDIINYSPPDANNHIINTLLIKFLYFFNDQSLFLARLPNILAFGLYIFYAYKITSRYLSKFLGFGCFLLLLTNPFVLDFFSLARGYGLALGFQMTSLYFIIKYFYSLELKDAIKSTSIGSLAVLSNFSFLNFWLVSVLVLFLIVYQSRERVNFKRFSLYSILSIIILGLILYEPIRKLKIGGNLYYGGDHFYNDTLVSLAKYSMYDQTADSLTFVILNSFIGLFLVVLIVSFYKKIRFSQKSIFVLLLLGCIFSLAAQNILFDTLYLIDRTALLFYPLIILTLVFSIDELKRIIFSRVTISICTIVFVFNFLSNANFYKTATWYFDAHTYQILNDLNKEAESRNKTIHLDFSWPFQSALNYYVKNKDFSFIKVVKPKHDREAISEKADIYIYLNNSLEKVGYNKENQVVNSKSKAIIKEYPKEHIILYSIN